MMLSMSVLYALRRAVLAAKNGLSEAALAGSPVPRGPQQVSERVDRPHHNGTASTPPAHSAEGATSEQEAANDDTPTQSIRDETSTSCIIQDSRQGNPFFVLAAPVTTCHGKEAMGQFSIVDLLQAAAGSTADLEYHSSGEWVVVH